jgi:3-phenylpropionate/trans-cinnamate dioxygenase ferredoxin subunit
MANVALCLDKDLPAGSVKRTTVAGRALCVARTSDGTVFAVADECTHQGASLSDGALSGTSIECPQHGSRFDLRTGAVLGLPAEEALATFPVRIASGVVYVEL